MTVQVRLIERGASADQTREIPLRGPEFLIGRAADCDLRLRIPAVSRHHCQIRLGAGEATLVDLGSSNGTFLNGQRVRSQAPLHTGDEIRLGSCSLLIDLGDGAPLDLGSVAGVDAAAITQRLAKPKG